MENLHLGLNATKTATVTEQNTAMAMGSGDLPVYATPAMAALMESAAATAVRGCLGADETTVGTKLTISHIAATPIGSAITATAELIAVDRRKLTFQVTATDDQEKIGEGIHERFIIKTTPFMEKASLKSGC